MIRDRRKITVAAIAGIVLLILAVLMIRNMMRLVGKPKKGDDRAVIYNSKDIAEGARLLTDGASATKLSDLEVFEFTSSMLIDGIEPDRYLRQTEASFLAAGQTEGVFTYRGNAARSSSVCGNAGISSAKFADTWTVSLGESNGVTKDLDWRGQALIVRWDEKTKAKSNISQAKKDKQGLCEVIIGALDGRIYFLDLEDGSYTRDPVNLGCPITGSGTICPDGTPLYVVGTGDCSDDKNTSVHIIDLLTGEELASFGERTNFAMNPPEEKYDFTAAALISDAKDCLITQGENGVIYSFALTANLPEVLDELDFRAVQELKYTYTAGEEKAFGESVSSPAAYGKWLFTADIYGRLLCTDVNDWHSIWMRDLGDRISATPVIEADEESQTAYIYIGTSLDRGKGKSVKGLSNVTKLNAATGDIIWQREYETRVTKLTDGGFVASPALGEHSLEPYVYFAAAGTKGKKGGKLIALNKRTGGEHYTVDFKHYIISDPVCVYSADGKGYVIVSDNDGNIFLLDGESGECLDIRKIGERITGSPAVFGNTLVIASDEAVYGIKIE